MEEYVQRKEKDEYKAFIYTAFVYQLFMKKVETDLVLLINFDFSLRPFLPLGSKSVLGNSNFEVPTSIMFGEFDWMRKVDDGASQDVIERLKYKYGDQSNFIVCPSCNHDMNCDNPSAVSGSIVNDLLYWKEEDEDKRYPITSVENVTPEFTL